MPTTLTPLAAAPTKPDQYRLAAVLAVLLRDDYSPRVDDPRVIDGYLASHPVSLAAANETDDD